jgi:archaeal type IV pilus assembly protein PilA
MLKEQPHYIRRSKMNHTKIGTNEEAVSPVIGVLLMVAITVILAAVIATFVFGFANNMQFSNKNVAVSVQQTDAGKITATYIGGQDRFQFDHATVNITDDNGKFVKVDNLSNTVGDSVTVKGDFAERNHAIVVGYFTDGVQQVLLDTYV